MGAQDFLKLVRNATIRPPIAPGITSPKARSGAVVLMFHVQAAVAMAHISSTPVLLTVPFNVMVSPNATPSPRNVLSFKAGLEVFINAMSALLFWRINIRRLISAEHI